MIKIYSLYKLFALKFIKKTFCGFSMGRNQYWAGRVYDLCVHYITGTSKGSTESGFMEKQFNGKTSEEKYAASLGTKAKQIFLNICDYFKKICQKHRDSNSHIERTVNVLGEGPTKITITNASIGKRA